jgi:hypothetical protein
MTEPNSKRVVAAGLALTLLAARPADAPQAQVLTLASPNEENGRFGVSVAGAGDVNGDGFADLIVGAFLEGALPGAGRAYLYSGKDGTLLFELVSPNEEQAGWFGYSVAGAGDVDQDGFADAIVGANLEDTYPNADDGGRAYVFSGQDAGLLLELVSPNSQARLGRFGQSVAGVGDLNQDGVADLLVGAPSEETDTSPTSAGRVYAFSGRDGALLLTLVSPNEESVGFFGHAVASPGDVDADGVADLLVGAFNEDPGNSPSDAGRAYVFSGGSGSLLYELASPNEQARGQFGYSVAGAGDLDADGAPDLIVGTETEVPDRAYVFSGWNGSLLFQLTSPDPGFGFGRSVDGPGDVTQDEVPDVMIGDWDDRRAYIFSGQDGSLQQELQSPNLGWGSFGWSVAGAGDVDRDNMPDVIAGDPDAGRAFVFLSGRMLRVNSGGPNYTDTNGSLFLADRAYAPRRFGYIGGLARRFTQPIGGTDDDPLYQDVRLARTGADGSFAYRFDVPAGGHDVTLYLMAPELEGTGNVVMDVWAEEDQVFDDLDVTAEAGGEYQALVKTFAVEVGDGTLDLRFRAVNKAAVVSAIAVAAQPEAVVSRLVRRRGRGGS